MSTWLSFLVYILLAILSNSNEIKCLNQSYTVPKGKGPYLFQDWGFYGAAPFSDNSTFILSYTNNDYTYGGGYNNFYGLILDEKASIIVPQFSLGSANSICPVDQECFCPNHGIFITSDDIVAIVVWCYEDQPTNATQPLSWIMKQLVNKSGNIIKPWYIVFGPWVGVYDENLSKGYPLNFVQLQNDRYIATYWHSLQYEQEDDNYGYVIFNITNDYVFINETRYLTFDCDNYWHCTDLKMSVSTVPDNELFIILYSYTFRNSTDTPSTTYLQYFDSTSGKAVSHPFNITTDGILNTQIADAMTTTMLNENIMILCWTPGIAKNDIDCETIQLADPSNNDYNVVNVSNITINTLNGNSGVYLEVIFLGVIDDDKFVICSDPDLGHNHEELGSGACQVLQLDDMDINKGYISYTNVTTIYDCPYSVCYFDSADIGLNKFIIANNFAIETESNGNLYGSKVYLCTVD